MAKSHGITLGQLALAWIVAQPNTCAIAGARNAGQIIESAKAAEVRLSSEDLTTLDEISRIVTDHLDDNPVMWKW